MTVQALPQPSPVVVEPRLVFGIRVKPFYLVAPVSQFDQALKFRVLAEIGEVSFAVALFFGKSTLVSQPAKRSGSLMAGPVFQHMSIESLRRELLRNGHDIPFAHE